MDILTIHVVVKNKVLFYNDNERVIEQINNIPDIDLEVTENEKNRYELYKRLIQNTDSKYSVFYDENNTLVYEVIEHLAKELEKRDDNILAQKISQEDIPAMKEYMTGGMAPNSLYFNRYIFKTEVLKAVCINKNEENYFADKIILSATRDKDSIPFLEEVTIYTEEALERDVNLYRKQFQSDWYIPYFEQFLLPYVRDNELTATEQRLVVYFIILRFYLNLNGRDKFVLQGEQITYFFELVKQVTEHIDDKYLIEVRKRGGIPLYFAYLLLKEKHQKRLEFQAEKSGNGTKYICNGLEFGMDCVSARISAINYIDENLIIDGELVGDYCLEDVKKDFKILVNEKAISWERTERYNIAKAFGRSISRYYPFQFTISEEEMQHKLNIRFEANIGDKKVKLPLQFQKTSSRLLRSRWSYYQFADKVITYANEKLLVKKAKPLSIAICEIGTISKILRTGNDKKENFKAAGLRAWYWITKKKYLDKPNWIFFDKLYKAGDNGEYLFRYCVANHPEANCYYIINKDAIEYPQLKKEYGKRILKFGSLRQKLVLLNTEIVFATHASVFGFCGFNKALQKKFKNLLNAKVVCIQHGLTIQNIAQYQNRLADNTKLYFCASKYEVENLKKPVYGYENKNLHLTGCPRYDGLKNQDKRQILIAPTWRRNIVITGNAVGTAKSYNPEFKHTKYFEIYNRLINDKRLINTAAKYNYSLLFLIHPTLSAQIDDYDKNEHLSIVPAISDISYEKMLTESSLMLTDYSGIQFDFAYMKKPVLYYQPKELPPQYTEGVYKYEKMAFGPIIDEYDSIINTLCEYIENECKMKEEYIKRVEDFFAYTDNSNCKRIMDIITSWNK